MASNPPPTGYGRGGRGAALFQAMQAPVRKPGEPPTTTAMGPTTAETTAPRMASLGRGMGLLTAVSSQPALGRGLGPAALGRGLGRGLTVAAVPSNQTPITPPPSVPQTPTRSLGRGLSAPQPQGVEVTTPRQPSLPASTQQVGQTPDEGGDRRRQTWMERMGALSLQDTVRKTGSYGERTQLACNFIPMRCTTGGTYQYAVSFSPQIDSRAMRYKLVFTVLSVQTKVKTFDGSILFLPNKLPDKETVYDTVRPTDGQPVKVIIKFVKLIPPGSCIQLYNIIFKNVMKILRYSQVGRNYYNSHNTSQIPQHKLEVWPGYITAIEEYEDGRLMLMTDVSHRLLRTETVYNLMMDITNQQRGSDVRTAIAKAVIGQSVLTRYNNKTYRVDDIDWAQNPASTFQKGDTTISYMDYYREHYNKVIEDPNQPILIHTPKKRECRAGGPEVIALIPELCNLTGLSDEMKSSFAVMKDVGSHTRLTPNQRNAALIKFMESITNSLEARQELANWGLELDCQILEIYGRQLPPEKIYWGRNSVQLAGPKANFSNQIGRESVITPAILTDWLLIGTKRDEQLIHRFLTMLVQEASKMGMRLSMPQTIMLGNDGTANYLKEMRQRFIPQVTQLIMTICPTSRDDRYNAIKKLCYVETPVASQVINTPTIRNDKKLRSITQKVALQINAKLGGELWALDVPGKGLMVCGVDVFHGPTNAKGPSHLGFVASLNQKCTRWFSTTSKHMERQEIAHGLRVCLTRAITKYHQENHFMPERIIMFRDGVGDGQLNTVAGFEVPQLQEVFPQIQASYLPKLAVIVVQKRINQRIFKCARRGDLDNPMPGTVVDHTITRRHWYDFFLVSQHVGQGTVSPTHYVIVHDGSGWDPDKLQRLSYKLTHLYYNWPGTIRVPAPCQYAHKLAYMVGQNLSGKEPAPEISDRLFYL